MPTSDYISGFVAILGRPNIGKSTLVNTLVAEKISIVSPKPQTTRHSILGIRSEPNCQMVFVDTPGLHPRTGKLINQAMNRSAGSSAHGADLVLFMVDARGWRRGDEFALKRVQESGIPLVLLVNKIDLIKPKESLLPVLADLSRRGDFDAVVPISALTNDNLDTLLTCIRERLPAGDQLFPAEMKTDRGRQFRVAEVIREKLMLRLRDEVPYGIAVEVRALEEEGDLWRVDAVIWVDRESHRGIVVGKGGEGLKTIGKLARLELEALFGRRVHLETRVKAKENWTDNAQALRQLGYEDSS